ncbi:MAG: protein-glutamate O-methyltransferase CheR, partial [Rhodospirillales bacterium]|nr:protein-glutamate O-methyltransferase CheR [Acetobacter sp.]
DIVVPPEEIAVQLAGLAKRFRDPRWRQIEEGQSTADESRDFVRILKLLKGVSGVDFRLYKPTTIQRRIARRMALHKMDTLAEYTLLLQTDGPELRALQEDILINVTRFFRDPDVFHVLKTDVIPRIVEDREPEHPIRVWVAGCSTGEEVYSIAICLLEQFNGASTEPNIQIFGTDASEDNVHKARLGIYAESITNEVSQERLRRFFSKTEKGYQINKRVRDLCIFARQNLCTDPPFSRLDLVSCRNVLIYFGPDLQRRVISTFHYALRRDGFLLLGNSESIREYTDLFSVMDRTHKLFARMENPGHRAIIPSFAPLHFPDNPLDRMHSRLTETRKDADLSRLADRTILARYGPPGVVINAQMEILQTRGRTSLFLEMTPGAPSLNLRRMVRDSIAPEVTAAVTRSLEAGMPVQVDPLRVTDGDQTVEARLEVLPMPTGDPGSGIRYFLVTFLPPTQYAAGIAVPLASTGDSQSGAAEPSVAQLRQELASTKLYLNSLLDEREANNQELISANVEIQSSNEELQST